MEKDEYDYIICGGGTSGCVVAGRLAQNPNVSILLIEAGPDTKDNENVKMAGGYLKNVEGVTDWKIITPPMPGVNGRQLNLIRGKFLGGSSNVNGTLCIRGCEQDYDDWNLPGWSGKEMFAYMSKAEHFHPKDWFQANEQAHGYTGELHTEPHDVAPISKLLLKSMQDKGFPLVPDMFTTGETAHGCGHAVRSVHQGLRSVGADFVTDKNKRNNIDILCDTVVDKVLFEDSRGKPHATSVRLVNTSGVAHIIKARREIIIAGGSYCSPAILLRSGIGPKAELEKHAIECFIDSPGVGRNLLDHLIVLVFYEVSKSELTSDHLVYHGDAAAASYQQYKDSKTGFLASFPFGTFAFARLDERLQNEPSWQSAKLEAGRDPMGLTRKQPNIEYFNTELYGGPPHYTDFPVDGNSVFAMITELFSPRSSGTVTLRSSDPMENPIVDCNYLSDPLDLLVLSEGVRLGNEIVTQGAGTADVVKGSWPSSLSHHKFTSREDWVPYVKQHATTCYHPGGTCKMGSDNDRMAVLDARLQVKGVTGLRVADCSVMPTLNGGHTQMPAYGIGEKAADLIKEAAGENF